MAFFHIDLMKFQNQLFKKKKKKKRRKKVFLGETISGGEDAIYRRLLYKGKKLWHDLRLKLVEEKTSLWRTSNEWMSLSDLSNNFIFVQREDGFIFKFTGVLIEEIFLLSFSVPFNYSRNSAPYFLWCKPDRMCITPATITTFYNVSQ